MYLIFGNILFEKNNNIFTRKDKTAILHSSNLLQNQNMKSFAKSITSVKHIVCVSISFILVIMKISDKEEIMMKDLNIQITLCHRRITCVSPNNGRNNGNNIGRL